MPAALSTATSVPAPIAMPTSAVARAGASFTPSPTIATFRPPCWKRRTASALSAGRTSAATSSMPSRRATESATAWLSPVIIATRILRAWSASTASFDSGRISSSIPTTPPTCPSTTTWRTVRPTRSHSVANACGLTPNSSSTRGPPTYTSWPWTFARAPRPGNASNADAGLVSTPRRRAPSTMARASGCSESASTEAANPRTRSTSNDPGATSMRMGWPFVSVPVLSKMTVSSSRARSRASRSLTSSPLRAPRDVLIAMTNGIARPRACGQAMTRTVAVRTSAPSGSPSSHHTTRVMAPAPSATQKSSAAARSASACAREADACAVATIRMIPDRAVASPVAVTRTRSDPPAATAPAMTPSPTRLETGRDSPVIRDSSTSAAPSMTMPSAAIRAPGLTRITSSSRS